MLIQFNNNNNNVFLFAEFYFYFIAYSANETLAPITSHVCDLLITAQCMRKKTFRKATFKKKTFRSVNLLESLCKIVEFIFKICSYITLCRPRRRGWQKASGEEVEVLSG